MNTKGLQNTDIQKRNRSKYVKKKRWPLQDERRNTTHTFDREKPRYKLFT